MKCKVAALSVALLTCFQTTAYAHKTTLDAYGCHNNTALVVYECHAGQFAGRTWPNPGGKLAMIAELPTAVPVPPVITGGATLDWQAAAGATGYKIYWGVKPDEWQTPITIGPETSVSLVGLLKGATYYFRVSAFNVAGESEKSNMVFKAIQ